MIIRFKKVLSYLEQEGQGCGIIMGVTRLLLLGLFYYIGIITYAKHIEGECTMYMLLFFRPTLFYLDDNRLPSRPSATYKSDGMAEGLKIWGCMGFWRKIICFMYLFKSGKTRDPPIASVPMVLEPN